MNDYSEPLIAMQIAHKQYAEAMRQKRYGAAEYAALQMVRLAVDLLEATSQSPQDTDAARPVANTPALRQYDS